MDQRQMPTHRCLRTGGCLQVDQAELETVVPQPGGTVLVVNGPHRGAKGALVGIDTKRFQVGAGQRCACWLLGCRF
jgi:hypothetical protein